jgi:hypothetical protein
MMLRSVATKPSSEVPITDREARGFSAIPGRRPAGSRWLYIVFVAEILIVELYQLPTHLSFDAVAFGDGGLNLTVEHLLRQGYVAGVDFGYPYGGLAPIFGATWFRFFGTTPAAAFTATIVCDVVFAAAVATFASRLKLGISGVVIIIVGIPFSVLAFMTFAHALERTLLCWGLAEQAGGKRASALGFATAAVFTKPTMGYVYGFLLILIMLWRWRYGISTLMGFLTDLFPALAVAIVSFTLTALFYGVQAAFFLLVPLSGAKMYRVNHFGFLADGGRAFWYFPGVHIGYYFGTVCAFWFVTTFCLAIGGCYVAIHLLHRFSKPETLHASYEMVLVCALMHLAFVTLFFGSNASWANYVYVPVMGVSAITLWSASAAFVAIPLAGLGVLGQFSMLKANLQGWLETRPSPIAANLWVGVDERLEWTKVLNLVHGHRTVCLTGDGAASLLFDEFERPVSATMIPGQSSNLEIKRELKELSNSQMAVVPLVPQNARFLSQWTEFSSLLKGCRLAFRGKLFLVYERS